MLQRGVNRYNIVIMWAWKWVEERWKYLPLFFALYKRVYIGRDVMENRVYGEVEVFSIWDSRIIYPHIPSSNSLQTSISPLFCIQTTQIETFSCYHLIMLRHFYFKIVVDTTI